MKTSKLKLISVVVTLSLSLVIIISAVKLTLSFTPLYDWDISYLSLEQSTGISSSSIQANYHTIIFYLQDHKSYDLTLPSLTMSKEGKIHFREVKNIFIKLDYILYVTFLLSIILIYILYRNNTFNYLKYSAICLLALPLILLIPFLINFDKSFTIFHKVFFKNNYWEFDPIKDPVINILPQEYFFHCSLLILFLILLSSAILLFTYKIKQKKV